MGRLLTDLGVCPDLVVTSTAVRARTTVNLAAEAGAWGCPIELTRTFYTEHADAVLAEISNGREAGRLMVVGHEPTWSTLVSMLIGGGRLRLTTASVACVALEIDRWRDVAPGTGRLGWLVGPKLVAAATAAGRS